MRQYPSPTEDLGRHRDTSASTPKSIWRFSNARKFMLPLYPFELLMFRSWAVGFHATQFGGQ